MRLLLLHFKQYFALIAPVIDQRKHVFARRNGTGDLVVVGGFSQVGIVEMPVNRSITPGMCGFEDKLFGFAGESFRQIQDCMVFRIDQFDLLALCLFAARLDGRERNLIYMVIAVIIFLGRWENKPGTGDHPVD